MTQQSAKPSNINNSARCSYYFPNGMRCRLFGFAGQPFCPRHTPVAAPPPASEPVYNSAEVAAILTADLDDLSSPEQINTFLSRLLLLLAQDKISARRAAVLTYIASQLLRSVHTMIHEEKHKPMELIFDAPRPRRNDPDRPQPDHQHDASSTRAAGSDSSSTLTLSLDPNKGKVSS